MRTRKLTLNLGAAALTLATLPLAVNQALAAEYWLKAAVTTVDMPNPNGGPAIVVPMWGYASCADGTFGTCSPVSVPGPALTVPPGDTTLTVHMLNTLVAPTSLVINGQIKPMTPVWDTGDTGNRPSPTARVRSFDSEAAPGGQADYVWPSVKAGTYLYQSGTQPQVQVQMGLYGAMSKNAVDAVPATLTDPAIPAQAYAGVLYDNQATLLYSEIDPALHAAVDGGTYGTAPGPTSTLSYAPKYFLINGKPYPTGAPVIEPVGSSGTTLLRLLNAGLTTHVPMINGKYWDVVAEDGKPYVYRRGQYTALLPAAKTLDALLTPDIGATYAIMDRRLSLSNAGLPGGGMMAFLRFGALASMVGGGSGGSGTNLPPVAGDDSYDSVPGATLNIAAPGVLTNDTDGDGPTIKAVAASGTTANGGTYTLNANGSFSYTPAAAFLAGPDSFTYIATDGKAVSPAATVTITVTVPAAPSLSSLDNFDRADSNLGLGVHWSQIAATGSFPDIQIAGGKAVATGTDLGGQAIWNQAAFGDTQGATFTSAMVLDKLGLILKATGGTTTASPANYIRVRYESTNGGEIVVATMMGGSGAAVYVKQGAFPAPANSGTLSAVADAKGLVSVWLGSAFIGGVQLPDVAAWKGGGRIGIQLQTVNAAIDDFSGGTIP